MTRSKVSLAVGAVLVVTLVALAGPALAHEGWIVRSWGKAGTYEAHHHIDVCDEAVDSSVVSTRFHLYGVATTQVLEDPDGGGGSCGHEPNLRVNVIDHRLCGSAQGCTAITYH
jgi:hypothetical protein